MDNITLELKKEFYWAFEAASLIQVHVNNRIDEIKEKHETDEIYADFLNGPFKHLESYYHAVIEEMEPYLNSSPLLLYYGKKNEDDNNLLGEIVRSIPMHEFDPLSLEQFRIYCYQAIAGELSDLAADDTLFIFNTKEEIPPALASLPTLLEALSSLPLDDSAKMRFMTLYQSYEKLYTELKDFTVHLTPVMEKHFPLIEEDIKEAQKKSLSADYINETFFESSFISIQSAGCHIIAIPSVFDFNSLSLYMRASSHIITIGYLCKPLMDLKQRKQFEKTYQLFKALGDPTRLHIMQCLSKKKMYIQELAKELKLTPATISHHITTLFQAKAITIFVDEANAKKVFYEVNKETMENLKMIITDLERKE
ncbi:MAG: winged helix-turn-helix transcriptional regulator [Lachnospiraceae bacterium]|nr:winged helix-turn-helix transcriptional regulator [Lachnospiraceae bacterium]